MDILAFLGRFHPVMVHFPIGILLLAYLMQWVSHKREDKDWSGPIHFALKWGAVTAIVAALFGYLLSRAGDYELQSLNKHKWAGFITAGLAAVLYLVRTKPYFFKLFHLVVLSILITGHWGGSLTYGKNYLLEHTPPFVRNLFGVPDSGSGIAASTLQNIDQAEVFAHLVQPIFKKKCFSCHNPEKEKGGLMLHTKEGIEKGGENGKPLEPGNANNSLMVKRILLPKENEEHMPPDGKAQISDDELTIIKWWIDQGADYGKKVAELEKNEDIEEVFERLKPRNEVKLPKIAALSSRKLNELRETGIKIFPLAKDNPWLEADFSHIDTLKESQIKELRKASKQLASLKFSNSNLNDEMLSVVAKIPNLQRLYLDKTAITDKGLEFVKDLEYLQYLNLYNTAISDSGIALLGKLPNLRSLYLWQSKATKEGMEKLQKAIPGLQANIGFDQDSIFANAKLKPPVIVAANDFFKDTLLVELQSNFGGAEIRYTVDGSTPDSLSLKYDKPIRLDSSVMLKAIAIKKGWQPSEVAQKQFMHINYQPKEITINQPNPKYAGQGGQTLIDLKRGDQQFGSGKWLGFQKEHLSAVLDLGKTEEISRISVGVLEVANSWIFFPKALKISVSNDGKKFKEVASAGFEPSKEALPPTVKNLTTKFSPQKARYVKVFVESNLLNPAWHPNKGEPCWIFVDEIMVE